jgi:hypothetical protein
MMVQIKTPHQMADDLVRQGYTYLESPFDSSDFEILHQMMNYFAELPQEVAEKLCFHYIRNGDDPQHIDQGPDDCLIPRTGADDKNSIAKDSKIMFHFRNKRTKKFFTKAMEKDVEIQLLLGSKEVRSAMNLLNKIFSHIYMYLTQITAALDYKFPKYQIFEKFSQLEAIDESVIRLVRYFIRDDRSDVLAKAHYDRNFITAAIHNTHPGLADGQGNLIDIPEGQILLFTGIKAQLVTGGTWDVTEESQPKVIGGEIKAFKHQVVRTQEEDYLRQAIIFFCSIEAPYWREKTPKNT